VRDRLVTELKMDRAALTVRKPYGHAVDHLMETLRTRTEGIADRDAFYGSLGIAVTAYWVFKMAKHGALYALSAHCQMRVVDRLIRELALHRIQKHTAAQRAVLNVELKYTVFHALKYCVMTLSVDEEDERLIADLTATEFKMQYIYPDDDDENEHDDEEENVVEMVAPYDHEFVFNEDCKFRFYLKNESLFSGGEWVLFHEDTINLSDFCYNELAEHFVLSPTHGIVSLSIDEIPSRYSEEILAAKFVFHCNVGHKSKNLRFRKETNFAVLLPDWDDEDHLNWDLYARNALSLHYKLVASFGKDLTLWTDRRLERGETVKLNHFGVNAQLAVAPWCSLENVGGVIRVYCHSTLVIAKEGSIMAVSSGYSSGFGSSYPLQPGQAMLCREEEQNVNAFYGGTYATRGLSYDGGDTRSGAVIYGEERLDRLWFGSPSGYNGHDVVAGGGVIELIAPKIVNFGVINAGATLGGSGGSIKIRCREFENYGHVMAKGGVKSFIFKIGAGGDGRIAIYYEDNFVNEGTILPEPFVEESEYALEAECIDDCFSQIDDYGYHTDNCV